MYNDKFYFIELFLTMIKHSVKHSVKRLKQKDNEDDEDDDDIPLDIIKNKLLKEVDRQRVFLDKFHSIHANLNEQKRQMIFLTKDSFI